jgi:predicted MFS family arabinose efflux permease
MLIDFALRKSAFFGHQVGAALAAYGGGLLRVWLGTYHVAFTTAGLLALGAAGLVLTIREGRRPRRSAVPQPPRPPGTPGTRALPRAAR